MNRVKAAITSTVEVMPETYLVWLEAPAIATTAGPGQFVMVGCGEDTVVPRPLSVHRVGGDRLELLFKVVGKGTRWMSQREKGESLDIFGPLGNGFRVDSASKNLLLVAGGMGIAPIRFLADVAKQQGKTVTLALGHSYGVSLSFLIQQILEVKKVGARIVPVSEDGTYGTKGLVTNTMKKFCPEAEQVFACGPVEMYRAMAQMPELKGKSVQVSLEIMMGCGMGVCYGCTIRTKNGLKQVCKDGPVFEMGEVEWGEFRGV